MADVDVTGKNPDCTPRPTVSLSRHCPGGRKSRDKGPEAAKKRRVGTTGRRQKNAPEVNMRKSKRLPGASSLSFVISYQRMG